MQVKGLFSLRVLAPLLLLAVISLGLGYVRDELQSLYPSHQGAVDVAVIVAFSLFLAYVIMPPILKQLGFSIGSLDEQKDPVDGA